jgi:hypothetical protein
MAILLKRTREAASPEDGERVLVERRRPRGIAEEALQLSAWLPVLAPSGSLRRWFGTKGGRSNPRFPTILSVSRREGESRFTMYLFCHEDRLPQIICIDIFIPQECTAWFKMVEFGAY